jgi:hypothetical protein
MEDIYLRCLEESIKVSATFPLALYLLVLMVTSRSGFSYFQDCFANSLKSG